MNSEIASNNNGVARRRRLFVIFYGVASLALLLYISLPTESSALAMVGKPAGQALGLGASGDVPSAGVVENVLQPSSKRCTGKNDSHAEGNEDLAELGAKRRIDPGNDHR
jgi:hypothetical protein